MEIDPRVRRYVWPVRIVWTSEGDAAPGNPEALMQSDGECRLKHKGEPPGILLDFGRELHGGIQIENGPTPGHAPTRVRVRFGESTSEAMGKPNQDHAIHDHEILVPWYGHAEIGNTGFRFVRIDLLDEGTELHLKWVRAVFVYRDIEYRGRFECSDERLNQIWRTGAYTVHLPAS